MSAPAHRPTSRPAGPEAALRAWVEELALLLEHDGLPRMAGRIFGWLLVCQPAEQTMAELGRALGGSKASMSTMTRLLLRAGLVERLRPPGARLDHVRIRPDQWEGMWRSRLALMLQISALLGRGQALLPAAPPARRDRLRSLASEYEWFGRELPRLLQSWERRARRMERNKPGARP